MNWYAQFGGLVSTNTHDVRLGGTAEVGHCDRESLLCLDKGFGFQVGVGSIQAPLLTRSIQRSGNGVTTYTNIRDVDFVSVGYHGRLGLLFNPASVFGLGPILRAGVTHHIGEETLIQSGKFQTRDFHDAGLFLTAGLQTLLTGKTFGGSLEMGVATYPTAPGLDRKGGFFAQLAGRIQF